MTTVSVNNRLDQIENELSSLTVDDLIARAKARHDERIRQENELLEAQRRAKIEQVQEEIKLRENLYHLAVIKALNITQERFSEVGYTLSEDEKRIAAGEISFDSARIRGATWQRFPDFFAERIRNSRTELNRARAKLKKLL